MRLYSVLRKVSGSFQRERKGSQTEDSKEWQTMTLAVLTLEATGWVSEKP